MVDPPSDDSATKPHAETSSQIVFQRFVLKEIQDGWQRALGNLEDKFMPLRQPHCQKTNLEIIV